MRLLDDREAIAKVLHTVELFSPGLAHACWRLEEVLRRVRAVLARRNVHRFSTTLISIDQPTDLCVYSLSSQYIY